MNEKYLPIGPIDNCGQFRRFPSIALSVWIEEAPEEAKAPPPIRVPWELARQVVADTLKEPLFEAVSSGEYHNPQKKTAGEDWVPLPQGFSSGQGGVSINGGKPQVIKHPQWWAEEDKNSAANYAGKIPDYAIYPIGVKSRSLDEERKGWSERMVNRHNGIGSMGSEWEFPIVYFGEDGSFRPVDIQPLIGALDEEGIPISIEGWDCQMEYPSRPRRNGFTMRRHKKEISRDLFFINEVCQRLGLSVLPTAVMPFPGEGRSNFENSHVRHVLMTGMAAAVGRELTVSEAAKILGQFGVNGLHLTVDLEGDEKGLVGDERLKTVFELTHTPIIVLLKPLTLNGNLGSLADLKTGRLSTREDHRLKLPTARVGQVRRLLAEETIAAVREGLAPSLERASLCDEEGHPAAGVHNPLGRQKETGRIEFTAFDIEPNVCKVTALEALLSLYVNAIDRAVMRAPTDERSIDEVIRKAKGGEEEFFLTYLDRQAQFNQLATLVENRGFQGEVALADGGTKTAGELVLEFIDWVERLAVEQGIDREAHRQEFAAVAWLKETVVNMQRGMIAPNFDDYFDPQGGFYGQGSIAQIAQRRFQELTDEENIDEEEAYNLLLRELVKGYDRHLQLLVAQSEK